MPDKKPRKKPNWYGSPRHRSPEMYYGHFWVDHKTFDTIRLFADWNKLSLKSAVDTPINNRNIFDSYIGYINSLAT